MSIFNNNNYELHIFSKIIVFILINKILFSLVINLRVIKLIIKN